MHDKTFPFLCRIDRKAIKVKSSEKQQPPGLFGTLQSLLVNLYDYIYVSNVCVCVRCNRRGLLAKIQKYFLSVNLIEFQIQFYTRHRYMSAPCIFSTPNKTIIE